MQELAGQTRGFRLPRTQCVCCTGGARCWRRDSLDQRPTRGQDAVDIPSTTPPMTSDTHYQGNKETSKSILYTPSGPPWCSPIHCATRIQIPIYIHTHRRRALSGCAGRAPSSRPTKGEHGAADVSTATVPGSRSNSSVADRVRSGTPMALRSALCAGPVAVRRAAAPTWMFRGVSIRVAAWGGGDDRSGRSMGGGAQPRATWGVDASGQPCGSGAASRPLASCRSQRMAATACWGLAGLKGLCTCGSVHRRGISPVTPSISSSKASSGKSAAILRCTTT
eukprot:m.1379059 g.1379059  ORF g.1379059 m.1379059 type:complete len:280 (-) comp24964_c2_seq61:2476-3315(-)